MTIALIVIHVVVCLTLILVILLQAGRGQGLGGSSFTGSGVQTLFGTRTADFLTKATTVAAILFLFTAIGLDVLEARKSRALFEGERASVPVDVQQIQKLLEKIKTEEGGKTSAESTATPTEKLAPSGESQNADKGAETGD